MRPVTHPIIAKVGIGLRKIMFLLFVIHTYAKLPIGYLGIATQLKLSDYAY